MRSATTIAASIASSRITKPTSRPWPRPCAREHDRREPAPDVARERPAEDHERDHDEDLQHGRARRHVAGVVAFARTCCAARTAAPRYSHSRITPANSGANTSKLQPRAAHGPAERPSVSPTLAPALGAPARRASRGCSSLACDKSVKTAAGREEPPATVGKATIATRGGHRGSAQERNHMSYVDLHLHLLPGVDDGRRTRPPRSPTPAGSPPKGVRDVTVTPHVNDYWPLEIASIPQRVADARRAARAQRHRRARPRRGRARRALRPTALADAELELIAQGPPGQPLAARRGTVPRHRRELRRATVAALAARGFGVVHRPPRARRDVAHEPASARGAAATCSTPAPSRRSTSARCSATTGCACRRPRSRCCAAASPM